MADREIFEKTRCEFSGESNEVGKELECELGANQGVDFNRLILAEKRRSLERILMTLSAMNFVQMGKSIMHSKR